MKRTCVAPGCEGVYAPASVLVPSEDPPIEVLPAPSEFMPVTQLTMGFYFGSSRKGGLTRNSCFGHLSGSGQLLIIDLVSILFFIIKSTLQVLAKLIQTLFPRADLIKMKLSSFSIRWYTHHRWSYLTAAIWAALTHASVSGLCIQS